jgi:hypothetical protein
MNNTAHTAEEAVEENQMKWNMELSEIYRLSLKFYKGRKKVLIIKF